MTDGLDTVLDNVLFWDQLLCNGVSIVGAGEKKRVWLKRGGLGRIWRGTAGRILKGWFG